MRGIKTRGRKASEHAKERMRAGIQKRLADGLSFGAPRGQTYRFKCVICGVIFKDTKKTRTVCGNECKIKYLHWCRDNKRKPRRTPPDDVIQQRYLAGKSTPALAKEYGVNHSSIIAALIRTNTPRRKRSDYQLKTCKVEGCEQPVLLIYHAVHKKWHGTECEGHFYERRRRWSKQRWEKIKKERLTRKLILTG